MAVQNNVRKRTAKRQSSSASSAESTPEKLVTEKKSRKKMPNGKSRVGLVKPDHQLGVIISAIFGVTMMLILGMLHASYLATLHENNLWFSNIKPLEREISFRTEAGLYYSYYKQLMEAESLSQEMVHLTKDNITEHGRTINILERFNVYQEAILAAAHRGLGLKMEPIFFYLNSVFALQSLLIAAIYAISWTLSGSWVAACLTAAAYTMNRADTTRVNYTAPLRESFALPFLWVQLFFITLLLREGKPSKWTKRLYLVLMGAAQFFFILFWQFAQFIFLLQSLALFAAALVGLIPSVKVWEIFRVKFVMFSLVFGLQFGNAMIMTSLVIALIPSSLLVLSIKGDCSTRGGGIMKNVLLNIFYILLAVVLTSLTNRIARYLIHHQSDAHVFYFLMHKFGFGDKSNFDAMLYVCTGAFDWLDWGSYERLCRSWLLPLYAAGHLWLIFTLISRLLTHWWADSSSEREKEKEENLDHDQKPIMAPELAFHTILSVLFGLMGISTLRFKYLWTVYMCIYAGYAVSNKDLYKSLFKHVGLQGWSLETIRHGVAAMVLVGMVLNQLPDLKAELNDLREFYDPDTVQLMEWISANTSPRAAFTGSMQLLAGVKLCTGRPLANHPHYEDLTLRERTKTLYGLYGRTYPDQMYASLVSYNVSYFILEDSICLAHSTGCRTPDIVDMTRGQIPDNGDDDNGRLKGSSTPRFCNEIRYGKSDYTTFFKLVFSNKTFRVYRVREIV